VLSGEELQPGRGVEVNDGDDGRRADAERCEQAVGDAGHPSGICAAPEDVVGLEVEHGRGGGVVADDGAVSVDHAFGRS